MLAGIADTYAYIFMRTHYQLQLEQFSVAAAGVELHSLLGVRGDVRLCCFWKDNSGGFIIQSCTIGGSEERVCIGPL